MHTIYDGEERGSLMRRLSALTPGSTPRWGRMSASQMVSHLNAAFRASLGELPIGPATGALSRFPLNWLVIHVLPWPQGKVESPAEFLDVPTTTWEADLATLGALLERAAAQGPIAPWPPSRVFGRISGTSWGVLHRKHLDHHLRQFGV